MSIQKQCVVRYRSEGHVRFQIPLCLCEQAPARQLTNIIQGIRGVRAVKLYRSQQKLSIRYDEAVCSFPQLARQLSASLEDMQQQGWFEAKPPLKIDQAAISISAGIKQSALGRWVGDKLLAAKETAQAAKILGKLSSKGPKALIKDPEKATIDFLNDILVLYLIKVHWPRITQQWLVKPFVHRYEWLATLYMFYLLVRSRRPK